MGRNTMVDILFIIFVASFSFLTGKAYENTRWKKEVSKWDYFDPADFYSDSSWRYQEGYKLNLPNEISQLEVHDSDSVDLLASFIDDVGDIHFLFIGKKYPSDSLSLIH